MNRALIEFYRCPEDLVRVQTAGSLSDDEGFFRFGPTVTCYGKSAAGFRRRYLDDPLYDVAADVASSRDTVQIPFDADSVIHNLRMELYAGRGAGHRTAGLRRLLKDAYYFLRPIIPDPVRSFIQRADINGWRNRTFPHWPVDTTVENLCEQLLVLSLRSSGMEKLPFIWFWPDGARACVAMTHDVETERGRRFCSELMDIDESFDIPASFQIVPEGRYQVSQDFIGSIRERGFEVNVQDLNHDGNLFRTREQFERRVEKINRYGHTFGASGFRAAVLYRNLEWLQALEFSFDMSVPNVAHLDPQKGGCCTVMPYFVGDVLEIPVTTTQDYMLFRLLQDYSLDVWKEQLELIINKNGLISFIVHPDYITEPRPRQVYSNLLAHLRSTAAHCKLWFALPGEVDQWWRQRRAMRLVKAADQWRIEGPGAERAVIAFAKLAGNRIEYEVGSGPLPDPSPHRSPSMSRARR